MKATRYITALLATIAIGAVCAKDTGEPDFAFPDKVITQADKQLADALSKHDNQAIVRSLLDYSLAKNEISPEFLPAVAMKIDSIASEESDVRVKSLLRLIEADIYHSIYIAAWRSYDQREIPLEPLAEDCNEWSGEQFKSVISRLLEEATAPVEALFASPLSDWVPVIDSDVETWQLYPTLMDFVAYQAIDLYRKIAPYGGNLPMRYLTAENYLKPLPAQAQVSENVRARLELCRLLDSLHVNNPAPRIQAQITAAQIIYNLVEPIYDYDIDDVEDADSKTFDPDNMLNCLYLSIYEENRDNEWCGLALDELHSPDATVYPLLKDYMERFPRSPLINNIRNIITRMEEPKLRLELPGIFSPGRASKVKAKVSNVKSLRLKLVKAGSTSTATFDYNFDKEPIYTLDTTFTITVPETGKYKVFASFDGQPETTSYGHIVCSSIAPLSISFEDNWYAFAVDPAYGTPIQGVEVLNRESNHNKYKRLGITNKYGYLKNPDKQRIHSIILTRDRDSTLCYINSNRKGKGKTYYADINTDLSLYHPGDTMRWMGVVYIKDFDNEKFKVAAGIDVTLKINDPNGVQVETYKLTTDSLGRVTGTTKLPATGLSGEYWIQLSHINNIGWKSIKVNDYKLPTFTVKTLNIAKSTCADSLVTVTFGAESYSGFPIGGAEVKISLSECSRYFDAGHPLWSTTLHTDAQGKVAIPLTKDIFSLANRQKGNFMLTAYVTSQGGETQSANARFSTGKPYTIEYLTPTEFNLDKETDLKITVRDANLKEVDIPLHIMIKQDGKTVGEICSGEQLPKNLKSGKYKVIVEAVDTTLANKTTTDVTFYHNSGICPFDNLEIPGSVATTEAKEYEILYGNPFADSHIVVVETVDSIILPPRWIKPGAGMHKMTVTIPAGCREVTVNMATYNNGKPYKASFSITNSAIEKKINIAAETFRDKVVPGDKETLKFRVTDKEGQPVNAAAVLSMTSSAINTLSPNNLSVTPARFTYSSVYTSFRDVSTKCTFSGDIKLLENYSILEPEFEMYGMEFNGSRRFSMPRIYKARDNSEGEECLDEVVVSGYAATARSKADTKVFYAVEQSTADSASPKDTPELEEDVTSAVVKDDFNYRPSEIPLAFFEPILSTDAEGILTYTYAVPDANTSWLLQALAYTPDILTSGMVKNIVASRPIMVQPTLPRFLRYGDEARLKATVMNATDSVITAVTTVTILDALTMRELTKSVFTDVVEANSSITVTSGYTVPASECSAIIYRVKSSTGMYTDGEQKLIPLLPATQPIITSTPFFAGAGDTIASVIFPGAPSGSSSTLYLYDNPVWEIVSALPSLSPSKITTSPQAASRLYSAAVARGLMHKYPGIRRGLEAWLSSDRADSTLVSMLNRNDELKQLTLNATPWVRDAMNDQERLDALAFMLDEKNINKNIDEAVKKLSELAQNDGGLAWTPGYRYSSDWATRQVLHTIASLKLRGYLPADKKLDQITAGAIGYIDNQARDNLKKYGDKAASTEYTFLRTMLRDYKLTPEADRIIKLTIQKILKRWKNEPVIDKATDAVILYYNGYRTMARELEASIVATSLHSSEKGMWWYGAGTSGTAKILTSMENVIPDDKKTLEAVTQWLILAKTAQDWGNSAATTSVVEALLGAIPAEQAVDAVTTVALNGVTIENDTPQLPGMTVSNISTRLLSATNTLTISKPTGLPAMGSVVTRSVVAMDSIEAHEHPSVSIRKRLNVVRGSEILAADTLKVGDRVRVQLIIKVSGQLDYVTVVDRNGACMEPVRQLSGYIYVDGTGFYNEVTDTESHYFFSSLRPGTYVIDNEMYVTSEGKYSSGVATLQSQINPGIDANSNARMLIVEP